MADSPDLPGERAWRVGSDGRLPLEYWKFLRDLVTYVRQTQGNTTDLSAISARLDALEAASQRGVSGRASVQALQQEAATVLQLVGDLVVPGSSRYYGTDSTGTKGWHDLLLSALADVDLVTTPPADGDALIWDDAAQKWVPGAALSNPMTTQGDIITGDTGGVPKRLPVGADGEVLTVVAGEPAWAPAGPSGARGILITGGAIGGSALVPGDTVGAIVPANYTLSGNWSLWCDPPGSVEVDVRRTAFGSLPPGPLDTICGGNEPLVSSSDSATGSFSGWSTSISQGDAMTAVVLSASTATWFTLMLEAT